MLHRDQLRISALEFLECRRLLAAGDLDTSFGKHGIVKEFIDIGSIEVDDLAVISGNKFLVGGSISTQSHHTDEFQSYLLRQYNADGSLDSNFGTDGTATGNFIIQSEIQRLAIASDGKIFAIVYENNGVPTTEYHLLARFNSDGSVDKTFGHNGNVQLSTDVGEDPGMYDLAIDANDKPLVVWDDKVRRYDTDGTLDSSFGDHGEVNVFAAPRTSEAITVLSSGKIVVSGDSDSIFAGMNDETGLVAELNSDGSRNSAFGNNGIATVNFVPNRDIVPERATDVIEGPGGKILVAGWALGYAAARLDANGQLDTTFGTNGVTVFSEGDTDRVLLDGQSRIYLAGPDGDVTRLTPNGEFDTSFGIVTADGESPEGFGSMDGAVGLLSDGRLIQAGSITGPHPGMMVIARRTADDGQPSPVRLSGRTLLVPGTSGNDFIDIVADDEVIQASLNGFGRQFNVSQVDQISITGGDGNDNIDAGSDRAVPIFADGGNGRDKIAGGFKNDTLMGDGGRDFIDGGAGADHIIGGGGNDQLRGQTGNDLIHGGPGNDYLEGDSGNDRLDGGSGLDTVHGNDGDDFITANDGAIDSLFGDGGTDTATADAQDLKTSIEILN